MHACTSKTTLAVLIALALGAQAAEPQTPESVTGYRGDRNGDYRGCTPPTTWDEATKKNLAWKTMLPNWCYGLPIVVGQKVLVMSEPGWKSDFPELVCLDLNTGKILWQKQVDHLELAVPDAARREKIRAAWASLLARMRLGFSLVAESWDAGEDAAKQSEVRAKIVAAFGQEAAQRMYGYKVAKHLFGNQHNGGGYGVLRGWGNGDYPGPDPKHGVSMKDLRAVGLRLETFYGFGKDREGECFPAPASDGKSIYIVTDQGAHACFDLDGNLKWMAWIKPTFNPGGHDDTICRSPILADGLFITDLHTGTMPVIALEAKTGREAWRSEVSKEGACHSSKVMDVGGRRYLISNSSHVYRVSDGKTVLDLGKTKVGSLHATPEIGCDDASDMIFCYPKAPDGKGRIFTAVKLRAKGETIEAEVAYRLPEVREHHTMVVHDGKVYLGYGAVDIATGKFTDWTGGSKNKRAPTRWLLAVAGGHLYGLDTDGTARVFTLAGKLAATNKMLTTTDDPDPMARHAAIWGNRQQWNGISYSSPFTFAGNHILIRTWDHLVCFAATAPPN
jgi:hypothetical protein